MESAIVRLKKKTNKKHQMAANARQQVLSGDYPPCLNHILEKLAIADLARCRAATSTFNRYVSDESFFILHRAVKKVFKICPPSVVVVETGAIESIGVTGIDRSFSFIGSSGGLVALTNYTNIAILNPATKKVSFFRDSVHIGHYGFVFLGRKNMRLIKISGSSFWSGKIVLEEFNVNTGRITSVSHVFNQWSCQVHPLGFIEEQGDIDIGAACVNGSFFWKAKVFMVGAPEKDGKWGLLSYNLERKSFNTVVLPNCINFRTSRLVALETSLGICQFSTTAPVLDVWSFKQQGSEWSKVISVETSGVCSRFYKPIGIFGNGILMVKDGTSIEWNSFNQDQDGAAATQRVYTHPEAGHSYNCFSAIVYSESLEEPENSNDRKASSK